MTASPRRRSEAVVSMPMKPPPMTSALEAVSAASRTAVGVGERAVGVHAGERLAGRARGRAAAIPRPARAGRTARSSPSASATVRSRGSTPVTVARRAGGRSRASAYAASRLDEHVAGLDLAAQEALRERRAVVRRLRVGREDRHRPVAACAPEGAWRRALPPGRRPRSRCRWSSALPFENRWPDRALGGVIFPAWVGS